MLELAILGLLQEAPMHGYELRKELATKLGAIRAAISYGTLYPTLKRLHAAGWISEAGETTPDANEIPPLTSRRGRVVYRITAEGKERFAELLRRLVHVWTEEREISMSSCGSTTLQKELLKKGLEPDGSFYIQNEAVVREHDDLDLNVDPPPDLMIEVDITSPLDTPWPATSPIATATRPSSSASTS